MKDKRMLRLAAGLLAAQLAAAALNNKKGEGT